MVCFIRFAFVVFCLSISAGFTASADSLSETYICYRCTPYKENETQTVGKRTWVCDQTVCKGSYRGVLQKLPDEVLLLTCRRSILLKAQLGNLDRIIGIIYDNKPWTINLEPYKSKSLK